MGLVGHGIASRAIERWLIVAEADEDDPVSISRPELEQWAAGFRRLVFIGTVIVFPVAGFIMGLAIGA